VIAKFELDPTNYKQYENTKEEGKTYILAWTTTPWTLPGNVALAVGENIEYVKLKIKPCLPANRNEELKIEEFFVLAKERVGEIFKSDEYEIIEEFEGKKLIGKRYKPLFDNYFKDEKLENRDNGWQIYAGDFVTTDEGTGVVHIAPAFGEDDMRLGKEKSLPFIQHVAMDGNFKEEMGDLAGLNVKPIENHQATDIEIIKYLAKKGTLFSKEKYEHSYPHCWRCDTPLINYATSSWFVAVTKIKDTALKSAKNINWSPANMKEGRFGNWLDGARDWSISRQRFWASVMPIWVCEKCGEKKVIGSVAELEKLSGEKIDDLHKHTVDKITFVCEKCQGKMKRVPDVLDTWFDSGSMPYAQKHYPFENQERFEKNFPADFIAEGIDQTRAWFYYLHIIGNGIKDKEAFRNVIVNGIVLAEDGKKMAKKLKNYPDPMEMLEKYGADSMRYYLMSSPVVAAQNLSFKEGDLSEVTRGMMRMLWNSYSFFVLYAEIDKFEADKNFNPKNLSGLLDKWIISELQMLIRDFNSHMENYELHKASRLLPKFVDNLSNWYIRRSRKRFWKSENDGDKNEAYQTLYYVLTELSKVMAPFTPFIAEEIYKNLTEEESVHLADFPIAKKELIDEKINSDMLRVREIVNIGLQLRAKSGVKVRQPLSELRIKNYDLKEELLEIIKEEVNVKSVKIEETFEADDVKADSFLENICLDLEITPELKLEGQARELIRHIQEMRKEAGYEVDNRIKIWYAEKNPVFLKFGDLIARETLADQVLLKSSAEDTDLEKEIKIGEDVFAVSIKR
jgi:isoleucyl-tRNA synthetase